MIARGGVPDLRVAPPSTSGPACLRTTKHVEVFVGVTGAYSGSVSVKLRGILFPDSRQRIVGGDLRYCTPFVHLMLPVFWSGGKRDRLVVYVYTHAYIKARGKSYSFIPLLRYTNMDCSSPYISGAHQILSLLPG